MTAQQRLDLMNRIWESFTREPDSLPLTEAQQRELDRRMRLFDEGRMPTIPWEDVCARLRRAKRGDAGPR